MRSDKSFTEILAYRGRVVVFTPDAQTGVKFEQCAERNHAQVISTRGWADSYAPLAMWHRMHASREYAMLSCDQNRYVKSRLHATDLVWVGNIGDERYQPTLHRAFTQAMLHDDNPELRLWLIDADFLLPRTTENEL